MATRFQFSLGTLMLVVPVVSVWLVSVSLIVRIYAFGAAAGAVASLVAFTGISAALYRLVRGLRYGWAIAAIVGPALTIGILWVVAELNYALT